MRIVRLSEKDPGKRRGKVNWELINSFTEEDLERFAAEDGDEDFDWSTMVHVQDTPEFPRGVRRRTGLSQPNFAKRFGIDEALLRAWEDGTAKPDSAGRALLLVIDAVPEVVAHALEDRAAGSEVR